MSNFGTLKKNNRKHSEIVGTDRICDICVKLAKKPYDRKSAEARARFERPVWPGLFSKGKEET